jgi:hypothetical protein
MDSPMQGTAAGPVAVDAKTFQEDLAALAETMVNQVFTEGVSRGGWSIFVSQDISVMLKYALSIYRLLFYINADAHRAEPEWRTDYGVTGMGLVRSLIDCLYNVTAILQDPTEVWPAYRKSGFKRVLKDLDEDQQRYAGQPKWEAYVEERRRVVEKQARQSGFTLDEVKKQDPWLTLGAYVRESRPDGVFTPHQQFLKTFTYLGWRQYSALSHGAFEAFAGTLGDMPVGSYYAEKLLPHALRPKIEESYGTFLSMHIGRAATVLLCLITELQAYCRFDGHRINERICKIWATLFPLFETKELYDGRYEKLMEERGISCT